MQSNVIDLIKNKLYYICKAYADQDGIKHEESRSKYLTFSDDNSIIYESDKNGNAKQIMGHTFQYKYTGSKDGKLVYQAFDRNLFGGGIFYTGVYLIFTKDFRKLNEVLAQVPGMTLTFIYEWGEPGDELNVPDTFY